MTPERLAEIQKRCAAAIDVYPLPADYYWPYAPIDGGVTGAAYEMLANAPQDITDLLADDARLRKIVSATQAVYWLIRSARDELDMEVDTPAAQSQLDDVNMLLELLEGEE